ncbi:hypothetical protein [Stigmatella erecta]|uniref:Uncharacterized protein n=1 Tax=Stigmatella erecta TaxID=83460 RepID=A0A1I0K525_9BACT|nr:hypothetical protein [Stigmatella erecta]SEU18072.1 hypothetical protein SAMN05443639_10934 [Stigmatella erecta]
MFIDGRLRPSALLLVMGIVGTGCLQDEALTEAGEGRQAEAQKVLACDPGTTTTT